MNVCQTKNFIRHNSWASCMQRSFDHASRVSKNIFEVMPSRMSENTLLASRTKITFLVDPCQKRKACPHQNLLRYCQILEFILVSELYPEVEESCMAFTEIFLFYATVN